MDTHEASSERPSRPRPVPLLPLVLFAGCFGYFAWRFWHSGEHIHLLLALFNVLGLALVLIARRRR